MYWLPFYRHDSGNLKPKSGYTHADMLPEHERRKAAEMHRQKVNNMLLYRDY